MAFPRKNTVPCALNACGANVRRLRVVKKWSQDELAKRLQLAGWDVSRVTVATIEARRRLVSDIELRTLSVVLEATLDELVG